MSEQDEIPHLPRNSKSFSSGPAVAILGAVVVAIMGFSIFTASRMAVRYALLIETSLRIELDASKAHLWFEEVISGDRQEEIATVWRLIDQAALHAKAMLEGGQTSVGELVPVDDVEIRREVVDVVASVSAFRAIAEERWKARERSGIGSDIDQRFDAVFRDFLAESDEVAVLLHQLMANDLRRFRVLQTLLMAICVVLIGVIGTALTRFERRRVIDMLALEKSEANLSITLDSIVDAVITTDAKGLVTRMNPVAELLTAWDSADALLQPLGHVFNIVNTHTREPVENSALKVLSSGNVVGLANHTALIARDGTERQIADSGAPIRDRDGVITGVVLVFRDVSEEYAKDEQLRESQQYLASIVENEPECVKLVQADGVLLDMNPAGLSMIAAESKDQAVGRSVYSLIAEGDRERYRQFNEDVCNGIGGTAEFVMLDLNGDRHFMESTASPLPVGSKGEIVQLAITRDVTARHRAEEMESLARQRLALHVEKTPLALIEWNTDFEVVEWNPAASQVFGFTREEAVGRHAAGLVVPENAHDQVNLIWGDLLSLEGGLRSSNENLTKTGDTIICEWYNTPLVNAEGVVLGVTSMVQDVTERKRLDAERERLMLAIEQAAETVVITDADGILQYANPAFERISGYSLDEAIGQNPSILKSGEHDDSFYAEMWGTLGRGETWVGQIINRTKDGDLYTEDATISPVRNAAGKIVSYVAVKRDVSEEIKMTKQLRQAQKMEAVGNLAGGLAHDFNNLLQVISGFTELAMEELDPDGEPRSALIQVQEASDRASELTRQLLAFSRRQVLQPEELDLNDLVATLLKMVRRLIGEHIELDLIPGHRLGSVFADRGQIEQVLMNLCVNARDAMPKGGKLSIETENVVIDAEYCHDHPWASEGKYVLLTVNDTGCGMNEGTKNQIFEPFFTTKEVGSGTGLGLATVYGIVKQHIGMIQVYSEIGRGTTFKVYLPSVERSAAAIGDKIKGPSPTGTETILVAEDEEAVLLLARQILERAGYTVLAARDGEEAIQVFESHEDEVSLVLLDVVMPKVGGHDVRQRILSKNPQVRVLFTSGYSKNGVHTNFILQEGLRLIQKPYDRHQLLSEIRRALDEG